MIWFVASGVFTVEESLQMFADDIGVARSSVDLPARPAAAAQITPADRVRVVRELTRDDEVAKQVTTGLLKRLEIEWDRATREDARDFMLWVKPADKPVRVHWHGHGPATRTGPWPRHWPGVRGACPPPGHR